MNSSPQNQPDPISSSPLPPTPSLDPRVASLQSKGSGSAKTAPSPRGRFLGPSPAITPHTAPPTPSALVEPVLPPSPLTPSPAFGPLPSFSLPNRSLPAHSDALVESPRPTPKPQEFWKEHLAVSGVPVAISAPGQGWIYFNQAFCTLLGYSEADLKNQSWGTLTHPQDRAADMAQFNRLLTGETQVLRQTKRLVKRDGQPIRVLTTTTAQRRPDGIIESLYVTLLEKPDRAAPDLGARHSLQRLADLENKILHRYHKPEPHLPELGLWSDWETIDPVQMLTAVQEQVQDWSQAHRIQWNVGTRLPSIHGNFSQLRRAIENVFWNAVDALDGRPGKIEVSCARQWVEGDMLDASLMGYQPATGDYLALEIRDEGPGMDSQTQRHLFEPFFTKKKGRIGLGSTVLLEVIRRHVGLIRISSVVGRGTAIRIFLPVHTPPLSEASPAGTTESDLGMTVLLVDDEEGVRSVLDSMMEAMGCKVTSVGDAAAAIALLKEHPSRFNTILLDWSMPGVGGTRLLHEFRELSPGVPVILMSGYLEGQCSDEAEEKPSAFLQKPFTRDCLEAALKSVSLRQKNG